MKKINTDHKTLKILSMAEEKETITKDDLVATDPKAAKPPREKTPKELEQTIERLQAKVYQLEQEDKKKTSMLEAAQAEKRKPGITVEEEDGDRIKRKRPNSLGLSDLIIPPYTKNRVAIYRIISAEENNPATGLPVEPVDVLVPGSYTVYDRFEKDPARKNKSMKNIVRTEQVRQENGTYSPEDVIEDIVFVRGWLQVPVESKYSMYVFMELHPNNANNKFRPSNAPKIFERVDINYKSPASRSLQMNLSIDAANEVRAMKKEDVLAYAASIPLPTSGILFQEIKNNLMEWAMKNPLPYFKLNKNAKAAIQINVLLAMDLGLLAYRPDVKSYELCETEETFGVHTAAQDPMENLVKFLQTPEGKEWYEVITQRLLFWEPEATQE